MLFLSQPWSDYAADYGVKLPHNWYLLDQVLALGPWQHEVRRSFAQHQWPLWNSGANSGDLLSAEMQPAPYNPLNLLALLLPLDLAATFTAAMIFLLAGVFTFEYARELDCSEQASLIAAMGFAFSGGVVFWAGWTPLESWTLLPLILLAVHRIIRKRDLASWSLLTIGSCSFSSGIRKRFFMCLQSARLGESSSSFRCGATGCGQRSWPSLRASLRCSSRRFFSCHL